MIDEYRGKIAVRPVGNAGGGDAPQEFCGGKLSRQTTEVLIDQGAEWNTKTLHNRSFSVSFLCDGRYKNQIFLSPSHYPDL